MKQNRTPTIRLRAWALPLASILAVVCVGLLFALMEGRPTPAPTPTVAATQAGAEVAIVARVGGRAIERAAWEKAIALNQVMSELAGQPAPAPAETLQQLIHEELILEKFPTLPAAQQAQIEPHIAALEQSWGVSDAAVVQAVERVGLSRADLERAVGRLLAVQAGLEELSAQGVDAGAWLQAQSEKVEVLLDEGEMGAPLTVAVQSPLVAPSPTAPPPTPTPPPAAAGPPTLAPDFTLRGAKGVTFTLSEHLARGPVVLVFFQRGGG